MARKKQSRAGKLHAWLETSGSRLGRLIALQGAPALVLAAVILTSRGSGAAGDSEPWFSPALGYSETIDRIFVPMNWLRFNERDPNDRRRVVELSPSAVRHPEVLEFYVRSPLAGDVAADDEERWRIRGSRVEGLDPAARRAPGPFPTSRWYGDIRYGSDIPSAIFVGDDGRRIRVASSPVGSGPAGELSEISIRPPAVDVLVDQQFSLTDEANVPLADVRLIGRTAVVFARPRAEARIYVDTPAGRQEVRYDPETGRSAAELSEGGATEIFRNRRRMARFRLGSVSPALSGYRPFAGRFVDPSLGAFGRAVVEAYRAAAMEEREDALLTLDRNLHLQLQSELESFLRAEFGAERAESIPAAMLAMDGLDGRVLALPSHPLRRPVAGGAVPGAEEARNNNLVTLPVGSVAKVPVSAAILSRYPGLRSLRVRSGAPFTHVLGISMEGEQLEEASAAEVNFTTYLTQSSNRYATTLLLLALAQDPWRASRCPSEDYWLGDSAGGSIRLRRAAPEFVLERVPAACGESFALPVRGSLSAQLRDRGGGSWIDLLDSLFDLPGVERPPVRYDAGLWISRPATEAAARHFRAVSPQRESFELGSIRQFRNDYVNLILGGVHSRWTTIKVAEAYASIVSGLRVEATMVRPAPGVRPARLRLLDPAAREAILAGMAGAVRDTTGTAFGYLVRPGEGVAPVAALNDEAARFASEEIRIFAKTGTPTISRSREVPGWIAIRDLAAQGIIVLDSADPGRPPRLAVAGARPGEGDAAALSRHEAAGEEAGDRGLSIADLARDLASMRRELERAPREFINDRGNLILPTTQLLSESGARTRYNGGAIVVVIGRYCRGAPVMAAPSESLVLAINIQARGERNPAGLLARRLLQPGEPLFRRLFARRSRCEAAR